MKNIIIITVIVRYGKSIKVFIMLLLFLYELSDATISIIKYTVIKLLISSCKRFNTSFDVYLIMEVVGSSSS